VLGFEARRRKRKIEKMARGWVAARAEPGSLSP
jgi:hypothetical protein